MKRSYLKYLLSLLLFGSNGVVASFITLKSTQIVLLRSVIGSAVLVALFLMLGQRFSFSKNKKDVAFVALSGVAMAADWLLLFEGYKRIGVSLTILINYLGPAIVVAFSPLLFKEKLSWQKILALVIAMCGVFLISGRAAVQGMDPWGLFLALASAFAYALMVVTNKLAKQISGLENATLQLAFAALVVILFTALTGDFAMKMSSGDLLPMLWIALINTGFSCYLYFSSIGRLPAQSVAITGYAEPLFAVLLSALVLGEVLGPVQVIGAILIIGGALFGEFARSKPRASHHTL